MATARRLATATGGRPPQSDLRRAVSTVYYELFHALARTCADALIGGRTADRDAAAWQRVYRALDHGFARAACSSRREINDLPEPLQRFAAHFVAL